MGGSSSVGPGDRPRIPDEPAREEEMGDFTAEIAEGRRIF
jgi:hypothetical protein